MWAVIRLVQGVNEDIFIRTVRPRHSVNCFKLRRIEIFLLTYLLTNLLKHSKPQLAPQCRMLPPGEFDDMIPESVDLFTFWFTSLSLRLSLSPKFGLRPKISQKSEVIFVWTERSLSLKFVPF